MNKPHQKSELTSTLHLGVRSVVDLPQESAIANLLAQSGPGEKEAIDAIVGGDGARAMLVIHRGTAKGSRFLIAEDRVTIGRSPESAVFLDDVTISRSHAEIIREGKSFTFNDMGSLNGSYINNETAQKVELRAGDEIQIGKFHLLFIAALEIIKKQSK